MLELVKEGTVEFLGADAATIDKKFIRLAPESKAGSSKGATVDSQIDEDAMVDNLFTEGIG